MEGAEERGTVPPKGAPNTSRPRAPKQEVILVLVGVAEGAQRRADDVAMVQQGRGRQSMLVDEPEELLAPWDGGVLPDHRGEGVKRPVTHPISIVGRRGERRHGITNTSDVGGVDVQQEALRRHQKSCAL